MINPIPAIKSWSKQEALEDSFLLRIITDNYSSIRHLNSYYIKQEISITSPYTKITPLLARCWPYPSDYTIQRNIIIDKYAGRFGATALATELQELDEKTGLTHNDLILTEVYDDVGSDGHIYNILHGYALFLLEDYRKVVDMANCELLGDIYLEHDKSSYCAFI